MTISVDSHEALELLPLLQQMAPAKVDNLNQAGYADFLWATHDGKLHTQEGKQINELLGDLDAVEEQLQRQIRAGMAHTYGLTVRGIALPHPEGIATYQWSKTKDGRRVAYENRVVHQPYQHYRSFLYRLQRKGLIVREVDSTEAMAVDLAAMYLRDQKPHDDILERHIVVKPPVFNPQPNVLALMGLTEGIGESRALALVGRDLDVETGELTYHKYDSLWELFHADPKDISSVAGVGPETVRKLFAALGRVE